MSEKTIFTIWTIGHSTRTIDEFLELLGVNDIEAVADVRSYPGSRRYPHFNAETLSETLMKRGIDYVPLKNLAADAGRGRIRRTRSGAARRFADMRITWKLLNLRKV